MDCKLSIVLTSWEALIGPSTWQVLELKSRPSNILVRLLNGMCLARSFPLHSPRRECASSSTRKQSEGMFLWSSASCGQADCCNFSKNQGQCDIPQEASGVPSLRKARILQWNSEDIFGNLVAISESLTTCLNCRIPSNRGIWSVKAQTTQANP